MFELGRHACFYIPRKCRGVLFICCFLTIGIVLILILHVTAALFGVASHESQLTEKQLKAVIPKRQGNNKLWDPGDQWRMNVTNNIQSLLSHSKFVNLTGRFQQKSDNILKHLSQARLKLKDGISKYQNKSLLRQPREIICQPITAKTVFFIRIPKCASTSFVDLLKDLQTQHDLKLHFNPSGAFNWHEKLIQQVTNFIKKQQKVTNKLVYARHFYHIDFKLPNYTYITIVREPVSRLISSYLYYHFSSRPHIQAMIDPAHKNESLETCLDLSHEGCTSNLMTKYFCGHDPRCADGSTYSLLKAKTNLEKHFAVVGIVENLAWTYELFRHMLPDYFSHLDIQKSTSYRRNKNEQTIEVSTRLHQKIKRLNHADVLLYQYIKERFALQVKSCHI